MKTHSKAVKEFILFVVISLAVSDISAQWVHLSGLSASRVTCFVNSDWGIFAASSLDGIYLSADDGATWTEMDIGIQEGPIYTLAVSGQYIFAGSDGGVYFSPDAGYNWFFGANGWSGGASISSLIVSGTNIFAGTYSNGLYVSADSGKSWKSVEGVNYPAITSLLIVNSEIFTGTEGYLYVSTDNGASWAVGDSDFGGIISLTVSGSNIYAGTYNGVYVSGDNGLHWGDVTGLEMYEITALTAAGSQLYAGTLAPPLFSNTDTVYTTGNGWMADVGGLAGDGYINTITLIGNSLYLGADNGAWKLPNVLLSVPQMENQSSLFSIYPNPTTSNFILETNSTGSQQLQVFDITGKLLLSQPIQNCKTTIDAGGLVSGVYLVSLKSGEGVSTQKLVVTK